MVPPHMLTIVNSNNSSITRRGFLQLGTLGLGGLTLARTKLPKKARGAQPRIIHGEKGSRRRHREMYADISNATKMRTFLLRCEKIKKRD